MKQQPVLTAACRCGQVTFETVGTPITTAICHCTSCQESGRRIAALPGAAPTLDANGGTGFVLYRKDRARCTQGGDQLEDHRLNPKAQTRRVVATCCNSAMFLEFSKGHWLSIYRDRFADAAPPVEMRVMTRDRREGIVLPDDVPNYATHSGRFMWKLLGAWVAMGFRAPRASDGMART
jgi:hypothetical protein